MCTPKTIKILKLMNTQTTENICKYSYAILLIVWVVGTKICKYVEIIIAG
jgi:hypothetical protein